MNDQGKKHDKGKPRFDLVDPWWQEDVAKVLTIGASEYGANNWQLVEESRYIAAAERHLNAIKKGELFDPDPRFGLLHAANLGCCSMFLHHFHRRRNENTDVQRLQHTNLENDRESERDNCSGVQPDDEARAEYISKLAQEITQVLNQSRAYKHTRTRLVYDADNERFEVVFSSDYEASDRVVYFSIPALPGL